MFYKKASVLENNTVFQFQSEKSRINDLLQ